MQFKIDLLKIVLLKRHVETFLFRLFMSFTTDHLALTSLHRVYKYNECCIINIFFFCYYFYVLKTIRYHLNLVTDN